RLRIAAVVLGPGHLFGATDPPRPSVVAQGGTDDATACIAHGVHAGRVEPIPGTVAVLAVAGLVYHHALAPPVLRRFVCLPHPRITQQLVEETEVHQMQDGVLAATDVLVHRQPIIATLVHRIAGTRRGVARVVPARLHEGIEGVGFALGGTAALRAGGLAPFQ